ncbi:MAG TPA: sodium:proton antiporter NhaD [Flavilitoribacter sp.]|nr:sodium:proton antiporter NhaD [Flavilitoribacter sp.]
MEILLIIVFVVGYLFIAFEHPLRLDKTVPALLMGVILWMIISLKGLPTLVEGESADLESSLLHHVGSIAEILVFLLSAMTIVELVDLHKGFSIITDRISTRSKRQLMWLVAAIAFFLSAVLDNLTTTIVMVSLLRKLVDDDKERIWFASLVVIAANAGGAWSPIGDVTTTMLWIGHKVSSFSLIEHLFIPSVLCILVPLFVLGRTKVMQGTLKPAAASDGNDEEARLLSSRTMLIAGVGGLIFVPIFKVLTPLPPFMGILMSLGVVWLISEYIHPEEDFDGTRKNKNLYSMKKALSRVEFSSILFFLGILLAISALETVAVKGPDGESLGMLHHFALQINNVFPSENIVALILGFLSAIVDNVPLVAAVMGMYQEPMDHSIWHFIAYTAGTGGSMLIIGSAAGVAAMGMEHIDFLWYLRKIAWLAMLGYLAGAAVYLFLEVGF